MWFLVTTPVNLKFFCDIVLRLAKATLKDERCFLDFLMIFKNLPIILARVIGGLLKWTKFN